MNVYKKLVYLTFSYSQPFRPKEKKSNRSSSDFYSIYHHEAYNILGMKKKLIRKQPKHTTGVDNSLANCKSESNASIFLFYLNRNEYEQAKMPL